MRKEEIPKSGGKNWISRRREPALIHPSPNLLETPYRRQNADQNPQQKSSRRKNRRTSLPPTTKNQKLKRKSIQDSRERWQRKPKRGALILQHNVG
ncbi:hypothetical protein PVAP13_3KG375727 [Panicum virgatum]|uniref:Uncharacterized protein n=1 Tax=Panicum virgatum TaxID=38727 RepID=A0A8T0UZN7_PANVG|nr:hypothetical protein PVAP13_3KG375727 [Panicum virgatum]